MKVKDFIVFPSGTLIRKSTIQILEPRRGPRRILITCTYGEPFVEEIGVGDSFQAAVTDLYCQLNEE